MATIAAPITDRPRVHRSILSPVATLARRRSQLTVRTPRELLVPLLTPVLFALVIAPALKQALHTSAAYESFIAVGTIGLLVPLNTMFAGLSVIVDRAAGAPAAGERRGGIHRRPRRLVRLARDARRAMRDATSHHHAHLRFRLDVADSDACRHRGGAMQAVARLQRCAARLTRRVGSEQPAGHLSDR